MKNKIYIGLTGQTGAGKSFVTKILAKKDFFIIHCDNVANEVTSGANVLNVLVSEFSDEILDIDGKLNRKKLGSIVFSNKEKLKKLNEVSHPFIVEKLLSIAEESDKQFIVFDAPTLFESGLNKHCHFTVSIVAPYEERLKRLMKRDNVPKEDIEKRMDAQPNEFFYTQKSNMIIDNTSDAVPTIQTKISHLAFYLDYKFNKKINFNNKI